MRPAVIIRYTPEPDGRSVAIPVITRIIRAVVWDRCMMGRGTQSAVIPVITRRPSPVAKERFLKARLRVRIN